MLPYYNYSNMATESKYLAIKTLKANIQQLISKYELAKSEQERLSNELSLCKENLNKQIETNELLKKNISELNNKVDLLQLSQAFTNSSTNIKEAKKRINEIVKEIDKCISMLND